MITGLGVMHAEKIGIAPQDMLTANRTARALILNVLAKVYEEKGSLYSASLKDISEQTGLDEIVLKSNRQVLMDLNYVEAVGNAQFKITYRGLDAVKESSEPMERGEVGGIQPPPEIHDSLRAFKSDHPDPRKVTFVMMRFGDTSAHANIMAGIQKALDPLGITAVRADGKEYHDDLLPNVLTYIYGCGFGIAVFERIETDEFNPNVALEVGYMFALKKPVCLLKDRTLKTLHADLVGKLYRVFDPLNPDMTIPTELTRWLNDKGLT